MRNDVVIDIWKIPGNVEICISLWQEADNCWLDASAEPPVEQARNQNTLQATPLYARALQR